MRDIWGWPRSCSIVLVQNHAPNKTQRSADRICAPLEEGQLHSAYRGVKRSLMKSIEESPDFE